jgi:hypothetical protein
VSQSTDHGLVVAVPIVVHAPLVATRYSNIADATPEKLSAEFDVTATVSETLALFAGAVTEPVGAVVSYLNTAVSVPVRPTPSVAVATIVYVTPFWRLAVVNARVHDVVPVAARLIADVDDHCVVVVPALPFQ